MSTHIAAMNKTIKRTTLLCAFATLMACGGNGGGSGQEDENDNGSGNGLQICYGTKVVEAVLNLDAAVPVLYGTANTLSSQGNAVGVPQAGVSESIDNGYPQQSLDIAGITYTADAGAPASQTAAELSLLNGVTASAETRASIVASSYINRAGNLIILLNGTALNANNLLELANEINSSSALRNFNAELNAVSGNLEIMSATGENFRFQIQSTNDGDAIEVQGRESAASQVLEVDLNGDLNNSGALAAEGNAIVLGGEITLIYEQDISISNAQPATTGLFGPLSNVDTTFVNAFNPEDVTSYNWVTSLRIKDSLNTTHLLALYFVKQHYDAEDSLSMPNYWLMHVLVDAYDVGDPDTSLPPPENAQATRASYHVVFNEMGQLDETITEDILISNWVPRDDNGNPNGAQQPLNVIDGGTPILPYPPVSSNFVIDLQSSTQFASDFSVNGLNIRSCRELADD